MTGFGLDAEDVFKVGLGFLFGIVFLALLTQQNYLNIHEIGTFMCEQHELELQEAQIILDDNNPGSFKVVCQEPIVEQPLDDGYLVLKNNSGVSG